MSGNSRVARNILALMINQVGTWSITLILTLIVPHYLGPNLYGAYSFVSTYTNFLGVFIGLGTGTYLTWRIAREPEQAARLTFNTLAFQIPLGLALGLVALLLLPLFDTTPLVQHLALLSVASTLMSALAATCVSALGGFQLMRTPAFMGLAFSALGTALLVVVVALNFGVIALALTGVVGQALSLVALLIYTQRKLRMRPIIDVRLWRTIVVGGLPFLAWSAVLLLYWQIDVPMLKLLGGDAEVGWYALANRIIGIPVFLPTIIITAILPALSRERDATSPHFRDLASRSIRLVTLVNIPACVGTILLAGSIPALLRFDYHLFGQIVPLIIILAFNMPLVALDMVLGTVLIAQGRQKSWTLVGVVAAVLNPLANLWVIPLTQHLYGNGAIGASLTTLMSEVIMFVGAMILRPRTVFTWGDTFYIARCLLAACIMIPAVWAISSLPIFVARGSAGVLVAVAYGIVIYAMAAYTFQVIRNSDIQGIVRVVGARMGVGEISAAQFRHLLTRFNIGAIASPAKVAHASASVSRPLVRPTQPPAFASEAGGTMAQSLAMGTRRITSRPLSTMTRGGANALVAGQHSDIGPDIYSMIPPGQVGSLEIAGDVAPDALWYAQEQEEAELLDIAQLATTALPAAAIAAAATSSVAETRAPVDRDEPFDDEERRQMEPVPVVKPAALDMATQATVAMEPVAFTEEDMRPTVPVRAAPRSGVKQVAETEKLPSRRAPRRKVRV